MEADRRVVRLPCEGSVGHLNFPPVGGGRDCAFRYELAGGHEARIVTRHAVGIGG